MIFGVNIWDLEANTCTVAHGFMNYFGEGGRNKGRKITVEIESSNMDTVRQNSTRYFVIPT